MRALVIYTPADKQIVNVMPVPGEVISVNPNRNHVIEDTEILKTFFTDQGYDVQPIIDFELNG